MTPSVFEGYRLSPQQERLWGLVSGGEGLSAYRAECRVLLQGDPDAGLLAAALRDVMSRHEVLRTGFRRPFEVGKVLQVILEQGRLRFAESDVSGLPSSSQASASEGLWRASGEDLDLASGPAVSALLVKRSGGMSDLWLGLPALSADAASLSSLIGDLAAAYGARRDGGSWSGEAVQYADVSEVLNDLLVSEETKRGETHWSGVDLSGGGRLPYERQEAAGRGVLPCGVALGLEEGAAGCRKRRGGRGSRRALCCWRCGSRCWRA